MTWNLLTVSFGNNKYRRGQSFLNKLSKQLDVNHFAVDEESLFNSEIYKENEKWFSKENNYGHFAWKPYFLLQTMEKLEEDDKILALDALDIFHPEIFKAVDDIWEGDPCLLPLGNSVQGEYTKRDCFHYMDCDEEDYWESKQLEAGFTFWRVCDESKKILKDWLKWCLDERTNGEVTTFSGKGELDGFEEVRHDQSILTNIAIRDGLPVVGSDIRNFIECNADYWYERYNKGIVSLYRPIDQFLVSIKDQVDYLKPEPVDSLILTVHNQEDIIGDVLKGIEDNTDGNYELIVVVDGCTDKSEEVITDYLKNSEITNSVINTPDVFETKANNAGLKLAQGKYVTIIQDDMVIREKGWNTRMRKPFEAFDDVFAVTARTAHNYEFNPNSTHLGMEEDLDNCWCDIVDPCDEANQSNIDRNTFAVRGTVNRGPLMIDSEDLRKMNYFDEEFSPQDMDDHDLMFRMRKKLNKVVGCYWIDFVSDPSWGGTRKETGEPAPWLYKSQHKNSKIFYKRNKDNLERIIINRELPE